MKVLAVCSNTFLLELTYNDVVDVAGNEAALGFSPDFDGSLMVADDD